MGDRLPVLNDVDPPATNYSGGPSSSDYRDRKMSSSANHSRYEELMEGSVPCPSCYGSGRVPKEMESQLVAIIPMNDKRLKPRKTFLWVMIAVIVCLVIGGLLLFFLVPRSVDLSVNADIINPNYAIYEENKQISINFLAPINVTNRNFYSIRVVKAELDVMTDRIFYRDQSVLLGKGSMVLHAQTISIHSFGTVHINTTILIDGGNAWEGTFYTQCKYIKYFTSLFQYTVTVEYMGHSEQSTDSTRMKICCGQGGPNSTDFCGNQGENVGYFDSNTVMLNIT